MSSVPTPPPPGSMTVPPMFGWEDIATVLTLVLIAAVVTFVALAAGRSRSGRSDWLVGLDARSSRRQEPAPHPGDRPDELVPSQRAP